jgi:hypothetical protein
MHEVIVKQVNYRSTEDLHIWNNFVNNNNGSCFNYLQWQSILIQSYNANPINIMVCENDTIVGVVSGYFTNKNKFFFVKKGILGFEFGFNNFLSDSLIRNLGFNEQYSVFSSKKTSIILDIGNGEEYVWRKIRRETRKDVRKGVKNNLIIERGWFFLDQFYKVYVDNMIQNSASIHSKKYFIELAEKLGKKAALFVVLDNSKVIAGMVVLYSETIAEFYIGAWNRKYAKKSPYTFMYWNAIVDAIKKGMERVDMGESKIDSGTYKYKINFGGRAVFNESFYVNKINKNIAPNIGTVRKFVLNRIKHILSFKIFKRIKRYYLMNARKNNKIV